VNARQLRSILDPPVQIVTLSPLLLGFLSALREGRSPDWAASALVLVASGLIGLGTTAHNAVSDFEGGVDGRLSSSRSEGEDAGPKPSEVRALAAALFISGTVAGILLCLHSGWEFAVAGLAGLAVAFCYDSGPLPLSRSPLGEIFVGLAQGSLLFLVAYATQSPAGLPALVELLPSAFFVASILAANNSCDREGDLKGGRRTLSIILGARWAAVLPSALVAAGWSLAFVARLSSKAGVLSLAAAALAAAACSFLLVGMGRRGYCSETKKENMGAILGVFVLFTAAMGLSIALGSL
jgi:1,4-dihydroxy-2-naphthoate polyprenyltransferase